MNKRKKNQLAFIIGSFVLLGSIYFSTIPKLFTKIQVYTVPKESAATPSFEVQAHDHSSWVVPAHWREKPATGMRLASYGYKSKEGYDIDISVIALGGEAGSLLGNVNRWRGQLQLKPITSEGLKAVSKDITYKNEPIKFIALVSDAKLIGDKRKMGMLVGIRSLEGRKVFFKMTGESELVESQKSDFIRMVKESDVK